MRYDELKWSDKATLWFLMIGIIGTITFGRFIETVLFILSILIFDQMLELRKVLKMIHQEVKWR